MLIECMGRQGGAVSCVLAGDCVVSAFGPWMIPVQREVKGEVEQWVLFIRCFGNQAV